MHVDLTADKLVPTGLLDTLPLFRLIHHSRKHPQLWWHFPTMVSEFIECCNPNKRHQGYMFPNTVCY